MSKQSAPPDPCLLLVQLLALEALDGRALVLHPVELLRRGGGPAFKPNFLGFQTHLFGSKQGSLVST